ncbi:MAG: Rrf2 family transcriptional regulator [Oscillospiraceae bacterium]|nr:Rrf2 family transcriptional regulator [Oscillospiraceae bacterium]
MKISTKGRYALRMMIDIAENNGGIRSVPVKDISERQGISLKYLEQIVTNLKRAGLLRSERGAGGGYILAKNPEEYTAGEILRAIEGRLAPVACLEDDINRCGRKRDCRTLGFWTGLYKVIDDYADSVTLMDFMEERGLTGTK